MDKAIAYTNKDILVEIRKAASFKFKMPQATVIEDKTLITAAKMLLPEELQKLPDWARLRVEKLLEGPDSGGRSLSLWVY